MSGKEPGFRDLMWRNKGWWLTPLIVVLLVVGAMVLFAGGEDSFIYRIF